MAKILIADDEAAVRNVVRKLAEEMGHNTIEVVNGKEAWKIFQNESIDLSFVDVKMPEMDGLEFLKKAKNHDPHSVIIIMTGYPSAETIVETIEDEGYTYVTKPLHIARIKDLIERGLAFRKIQLKG